jgi:hypothetical protein
MITQHIDHEAYIAKNAPDLSEQLRTFRDREFGDIAGTYESYRALYSVEWRVGDKRYSYTATERECIAYIEGYMDGARGGDR